jgi:hypothetical protein
MPRESIRYEELSKEQMDDIRLRNKGKSDEAKWLEIFQICCPDDEIPKSFCMLFKVVLIFRD